jgi:large subunit ribosomal protein L22
MSARKARLVVDLIDGKTVEEANFILDNVNKKAAVSLKKALNSAFANANQNKQDKLLAKDMSISGIRVDDGPMLKRYRAATMGRATPIRHRTSHIYLELDKIAAKTGAKKKVPKGVKK